MDKITHYIKSKKHLITYAVLGGCSTLIHTAMATFVMYGINQTAFLGNLAGFCTAVPFSYFMNAKFVFKKSISLHSLIKFITVNGSSLLVILIFSWWIDYSQHGKYWAILFSLTMPVITYFVHKYWSFAKNKAG